LFLQHFVYFIQYILFGWGCSTIAADEVLDGWTPIDLVHYAVEPLKTREGRLELWKNEPVAQGAGVIVLSIDNLFHHKLLFIYLMRAKA